ncbi:phosphotransferase [Paraburkholderia kirstenboschensis]|uniref:Aminoglycoside phosphotransferase domain-containing protein n=1 Tax=Paraburkholderia kirstenboschensis TaxID=1245436 RepID=A0ABZ0E9X5_9BURK|nr:phosphotransferase [Paraburkholderia kirstenboschensis]WOD14038.1 hypothetical protein RW095_00435 [Paraburkholderia kirstenboschensis]
MLLILSGEYVESELASEFGKIPPCFLPVGNRRLYTYQLGRLAQHYKRVNMTLPADFDVDAIDFAHLDAAGVAIFRTAPQIMLGAAALTFLAETRHEGRIDILFGDTLVTEPLPTHSDWLAVGESDENYRWHHERRTAGLQDKVWVGMFSFSDAVALRRLLATGLSFIEAIEAYSASVSRLELVDVGSWLDFGHVHTYFSSKRHVTTQRFFNDITVADGILQKTSRDSRKILAEANWFENAPGCVRSFLPNLIEVGRAEPAFYALEYLPLAALNELYVFGNLPEKVWAKIFRACNNFFSATERLSIPEHDRVSRQELDALYRGKTVSRLEKFGAESGVSLHEPWVFEGRRVPSLMAIADEAADAVLRSPNHRTSFVHGDFCLSNVLFDFRSGKVKLIDPRGLNCDGEQTLFGDFRYEVGKLAHSVIGLYDFIIAGRFNASVEGKKVRLTLPSGSTSSVRQVFLSTHFRGRLPEEWDCYPIMVLLFLSMLPLHADDVERQTGLMANALRLYTEWKNDSNTYGRKQQPVLRGGIQSSQV